MRGPTKSVTASSPQRSRAVLVAAQEGRQALELFQVHLGQLGEHAVAGVGELQPHHSMIHAVPDPPKQPQCLDTVGQPPGGVVLHQQVLGDLPNGGVLRAWVSSYRQQQLVLRVGQPVCCGSLTAPLVEPPQGRPKREKPFIVFVVRHWVILVCRNPIYL